MRHDDDTLVILHAPGHAPDMTTELLDLAEASNADSIAYTEMYRLAGRALHSRRDYYTKVGYSKVDTRAVRSPMGDAGDNPISVHVRRRIISHNTFLVVHPGPLRWLKFTPERWFNRVTYQWGDAWVTHISVHPSPRFSSPRKWRRVMDVAIREVHAVKAAGHHVILTGDLQTGFAEPMLRKAGLEVWREGVDYVAFSRTLMRTKGQASRPKGMDHDWMLATFKVAR